jgi:hypothetical protein
MSMFKTEENDKNGAVVAENASFVYAWRLSSTRLLVNANKQYMAGD